jgi:glycosyltransferase involved in cell wall biosynthesis
MAGAAIRSLNLARQLSGTFDVTFAVPYEPDVQTGLRTIVIGTEDWMSLTRLALQHDAVVAQWLPVLTMVKLARSRTVAIYDLYDPVTFENLALGAEGLSRRMALNIRATDLAQEIALLTGDAFVCASETQRDLWLGALGTLGRLGRRTYLQDPSLQTVVAVVPFGIEDGRPPRPSGALHALAGDAPPGNKIVLWGGGIWDWLDPITVIDAVAELSTRRDDVRLVFLGVKHPNPDIPAMDASQRAIEHADNLGLRDQTVFFNFDWVSYEGRGAYFAGADVGVSAHHNTIEARFAFRTRLVDYLWAGIPTVATCGDAMADAIALAGAGVTVAYGDVDGWVRALDTTLSTGRDDRFEAAVDQLRSKLSWSRAVEPLVQLVGESAKSPTARSRDRRVEQYILTRLRLAAMNRGGLGLVGHLASESRRAIASGRTPISRLKSGRGT